MASILTRHVTHWACLGWSGYGTYTIHIRQRVPVPANVQQIRTSIEEEWTNSPQVTITNLINSMRRRCEANGGHTRHWQVFWPAHKAKLHISQWPFIVASVRLTCAVIMPSNQHLDMPHLWGGMDYLGKVEELTHTDLDRFVNNIWEKWIFCVYRKSFRSLSSAHEKWEQKQKCLYFCLVYFKQFIVFFPFKSKISDCWVSLPDPQFASLSIWRRGYETKQLAIFPPRSYILLRWAHSWDAFLFICSWSYKLPLLY